MGLTVLDARWTEGVNRPKIWSLAGLERAANLEMLDLRGNTLTAVRLPEAWTQLRRLNLRDNPLTKLTLPEEALPNLESVNLRNHALSSPRDLAFLERLPSLRELQLGGEELANVASIGALTNLTNLVLEGCGLTETSFLEDLANLQELNLQNNRLVLLVVPSGMTRFGELRIESNPLGSLAVPEGLNLGELELSGFSKERVICYSLLPYIGLQATVRTSPLNGRLWSAPDTASRAAPICYRVSGRRLG